MADSLDNLTAIVAIDLRGAIGCRNSLPWRLRSDMKFFRETTTDNTVIMGRKTYDSIGGCLKHRKNVVLSHNGVLFPSTENCQLALSVEEALFRAAQLPEKECFVIGGAITYHQFAPFVDRYLVTIVDHAVADADATLSDRVMGAIRSWDRLELASFPASKGQDDFPFGIYELRAPDAEVRSASRERMIGEYKKRISQLSRRKSASRAKLALPQEVFSF